MGQAKRRRAVPPPKKKAPVTWILVIVGLVILAAAVFFATRGSQASANTTADTGGKISVDKTQIDFGDQHFGQTVTATFKVTNTGTGTLEITTAPTIEVKEGC